jgi:plastocyanin
MDGNFFFVIGIVLVIAAVGIAFLGIREGERFPPNRAVFAGVIALFVAIVATTMAFAIVKSEDEQNKRNEELAKENQEAAGTTTAPAGGATSTVDISTPAGTTLAYNQKDVSTKAGNVAIDFDNVQVIEHDVAVADSSGKVLGQTALVASGAADATVSLQSGTYTFYCTVPGHREAGMQGTLTVTGGGTPKKPSK